MVREREIFRGTDGDEALIEALRVKAVGCEAFR
jgi:hypothetical protein